MFQLIFAAMGLLVLAAIAFVLFLAIRKLSGPPMPQQTSELATTNTPQTPRFDALSLRSVVVAILALLMLIPLAFVDEIVFERSQRHTSVLDDIASTWGGQQTLLGPVLIVPFTDVFTEKETVTDDEGNSKIIDKTYRHNRTAQFLPESLDIQVSMQDEFRKRGIFESLVYAADITTTATFKPITLDHLSEHIETIRWDKAVLSVGLSDTRAINGVSEFSWDGIAQVLSPGTQLTALASGYHATLPSLDGTISHTVKVQMSIKGSGGFNFAPFGETTTVNMSSTWPHPSFIGNALPDNYDISDDGFSANWTIPHLARNYPQSWSNAALEYNLFEFTAGASMFEPVSLYSQVTRAVKYGILFIGLTFLTLFIFEVAIKKRIHIVQYALIGVSLCLFYLVLLALSEHIAFIKAYAAGAGLTIIMISLYTWAVLKSFARAITVMSMLVSLYAILYSLLQLEDYALLMGTALLVVIVIALMYVTRNVTTTAAENS